MKLLEHSKTLSNVFVGADPEVFIFNDSTGGFVAAAELLPENGKYDPLRLSKHTSIHWDNIALEYGVIPKRTFEDFISEISTINKEISSFLKKHNRYYRIINCNGVSVEQLDTQHFTQDQFGCAPFGFAWDLEDQIPPKLSVGREKSNYRFAGGHLHFGFDEDFSSTEKQSLIRTLDLIIGLRYAYFIRSNKRINWSITQLRMTNYGVPGAYREKPYGVEYRVPCTNIFNLDISKPFFSWLFNSALPFIQKNPFYADQLIKDFPALKNIIPHTISHLHLENIEKLYETVLPIAFHK